MRAIALPLGDRIAGARELAAHQFAHPFLQIWEAVEPKPVGEAHHCRWVDVELRGHLVDRGERHDLRMLDDEFGDPLLRLCQPVVVAAQFLDHVAGADRRGATRFNSLFDLARRHVERSYPSAFRNRL